jgi:hypothetical protein
VTTPYRMDVLLTGSAAALREPGLGKDCRTGTRLTGVAVGGSIDEPLVVTEPRAAEVGGRPSRCRAARLTVTDDVGIAIPHVTKG